MFNCVNNSSECSIFREYTAFQEGVKKKKKSAGGCDEMHLLMH